MIGIDDTSFFISFEDVFVSFAHASWNVSILSSASCMEACISSIPSQISSIASRSFGSIIEPAFILDSRSALELIPLSFPSLLDFLIIPSKVEPIIPFLSAIAAVFLILSYCLDSFPEEVPFLSELALSRSAGLADIFMSLNPFFKPSSIDCFIALSSSFLSFSSLAFLASSTVLSMSNSRLCIVLMSSSDLTVPFISLRMLSSLPYTSFTALFVSSKSGNLSNRDCRPSLSIAPCAVVVI